MAESFSSDSGLLLCLKELRSEEFWKFKELLKQEPLKLNLKPIPWPTLKKASKEDMAVLLDKHYPGKQAWKVMLSLLLQVNRRDVWTKAQNEIINKINPYKSHMKEKFRRVWEKETCLAVPDEVYQDCIKEEYEHLSGAYGDREVQEIPATVVLQGTGGVGKTTFLRKVMLEWAEGHLWKDRFTFVFFINVYNMNNMVETSLAQLASSDWPESAEPIEEVFSRPQRVLFMMNGFEELKCHLDLSHPCSDWRQQLPVPVLLGSLLRRKMLPESSLLLALGSITMKKYFYTLQYPQCISVPVLSEDARKVYFSHFFGEEHRAARALSFVQDHPKLFAICKYPLGCWMVCSCLKWQMERGDQLSIGIHSSTALYTSFVASVLKSGLKHVTLRQSTAKLIALCALAAEGTWMDTFVFQPEDLQRNGVSESDAALWVGMQLLRRNGDQVTFTHVCIQGFFSSLWYLVRGPHCQAHPTIGSVAQVVEMTVTLAPTYLMQTGFFLFGLCTEDIASEMQLFFDVPLYRNIELEIIEGFRSLSRTAASQPLVVRFKELFSSVFENQGEYLTTKVMDVFQNIDICISQMNDFLISAFCLKYTYNLQQLHMTVENVFQDDREHTFDVSQKLDYWQDVCSVFTAGEDFSVLDMNGCVLDNVSHTVLWKSLAHPNCGLEKLVCRYKYACGLGNDVHFFRAILHNKHLRYLNLHGTNLTCEQVKKLCEILKHPFCYIQQLMLGKCDITQECCTYIASVLLHNKYLKLLSLIENPLMNRGALKLCNALKQRACHLQNLLLKFCCLTSATCDYISQALNCNILLSVLDLGSNALKDEGVACICNTLRYPCCNLRELWLSNCYLTSVCCKALSALIISETWLRTLKLRDNKIEDAGAKELCAALKHPNCKLKNLGLDLCELTVACCEDLASVLISGKSLKSLNLDGNDLGHDGVAMLCEALSHPDCVLQVLGLDRLMFEEKTRVLLRAVEEKKPHLRILPQPWEAEEDRMRGVLL
ncbi:NACHT, LRR and PYD domains-containing protein 9 [Sturnira hondurensis]|uniref:NACHT, LRR and PYD domains-containing protein 9 n=1 Tax=Sturnira hondurensis TaxID=192404 RepID=UPI001879175F|nr:NACHT, LRR and PYD domains-containing protein 9 [Sturnira hondurensis]